MTIAEQALAYHANGYSIMPVKTDKRPALPAWKQYQTKQPTDDQVLQWFSNNTANIGIITGKISTISVIDIDNKGGQQQCDDMFSKFPTTLTIKTPSGGYHLYYQYHEGLSISANAYPQFPNVDIRSDGGYVVAPPSTTDKGEYKIITNMPIAPFPAHLFPNKKPRKTLTEMTTATKGNRNDTIASFTGKLLQTTKEEEWYTECLPAVERANKTYNPPLPEGEVRAVFDSIVKKEKERRENLNIATPVLVDGQPTGEEMKIMKSKSGVPFCNMSNVVAILEAHPDFRDKIRYNLFRQEIEIDGVPIEDNDIIKIQYAIQTKFGLHNISKDAVFSALVHCAYENAYDEAKDWLTALKWDGTRRLFTWLSTATGVEDNAYNRGVGTQWFMQIANRIMNPGCIADYMLVLVGGQGIGKTSLFRILGGKWYKSFTGSVENKDFYLTLRGALIIDLDEGATLYKAEAIKIKSIITQTEDEFRAPYDRVPKKFPRRFVFSMSTNEIEPFRDATGNRRYWAVDLNGMVNFKWLEENRDQLFAEASYWLQNQTREIPKVSQEEAEKIQEAHLPDDSWTDMVADEVRKYADYCEGDPEFNTTIPDVFSKVFPEETLIRLDKKQEMRIGNIFRKELGLEKRQKMVDGERRNRYYISDKKLIELQSKNATKVKNPLDDFDDKPPTLQELGFG